MSLGIVLAFNRKAAIAATLSFAATLPCLAADGLRSSAQLPQLQFEVSTSTLPRFDSDSGARAASRMDLLVMPLRSSALGFSLGVQQLQPAPGALPVPGFTAPSIDLGLHWRHTLDSHYRLDITAWRRMPSDAISLIESRDPSYGARVELPMGSTTLARGFVADKGFVGFQLESGARITVKRSGGKPMLYYRNTF